MLHGPFTLTSLPVELLINIHLFALSPSLPHTCKYIHSAIKLSPPSIHASYIYQRHQPSIYCSGAPNEPVYITGPFLSSALRYPICTIPVLETMMRLIFQKSITPINVNRCGALDLPKRIFRNLNSASPTMGPDSEPLPLLRFLWEKRTGIDFAKPSPNSNGGYPLVRAVHARFIPLVRYLLDRGADPQELNCLAIRVAIGKKDLALVQMLIEFEPDVPPGGKKRRKRLDRVAVKPFMLDVAVRVDAREIVQYFMEKGCVPHMRTLRTM
ncbi:hypothetical protein BU17DRAFT_77990 [Hysterangium stoloniferum]|nr:hypothetical protein BU17DRAFT_77990 [Hysterangium stoloniferum]